MKMALKTMRTMKIQKTRFLSLVTVSSRMTKIPPEEEEQDPNGSNSVDAGDLEGVDDSVPGETPVDGVINGTGAILGRQSGCSRGSTKQYDHPLRGR